MIIMEVIMNKFFITLTIIIVLLSVIGFSAYKIINKHNEKILLVEKKYIIERAKSCLNEKKCSGNTITLKELYDLNYLELQVNEVTKEYYNEESYVIKKEDNSYEFIIVS